MDNSIQESVDIIPPISNQNVAVEGARRTANYHVSVWGDFFLAYSSNHLKSASPDEEELQRLKEEVKNMLAKVPERSLHKLELIDTIQRLGVAYHFESEIEASLTNIYDACPEYFEKFDEDNDLHAVALSFRLLRQQGFLVSSDVFNKFKYSEGKFKASIINNLKGILSLYEAAHFRLHDEDILDETIAFTTSHFESLLPNLNDLHAAEIIDHALKFPVRKASIRTGARKYMHIYQNYESHDTILLNIAKLNFNILQKLHQIELSGITKWWKSLDCQTNFPFTRDRLVECYFWASEVYFEPHYCFTRKLLTKIIALTSIVDDIYDLYGTLDELTLFTDAIERWHNSGEDQLPSYMRRWYEALLDVYSEMEDELAKQDRSYLVSYAKASMIKLVRAYLQEAKWFNDGYVPTIEEYMKVALVTAAYEMLSTNSFIGMGALATKEAFEWVANEPLMVRSASVICRLMDDMAGHEFEQARGHGASAVECYMKHNGASKQEAFIQFQKNVTNAWKDISNASLKPTAVPMALLERVVNLARVIHILYSDYDWYTHSKTKFKS